jgi:hypothetical protein
MRVSVLILLGIILSVAGPAHAEKVKTNQQTKVYSRPGEHGTVLLKLRSGQNMTVLARQGRWLKVRVQGRTGYVPRSKVDMPDGDEIVRNTRRRPFVDGRSTRRGFDGEGGPDDRVGADATGDVAHSDDGDDDDSSDKTDKADKRDKDDDDDGGGKKKASAKKKHSDDDDADSDDDDDGGGKKKVAAKKSSDGDDDDAEPDDSKTDEPVDDDRPRAHVNKKTKVLAERDEDSDTQFVAKPGEELFLEPDGRKGKWTFVSNDDGDAGWIPTSLLEEDGAGGGHGKRLIDVRARLGLTFIQQGMRTVGSTFTGTGFNPDNYNLGTSALTLALAGSYYKPYGKDYVLGADLAYTYAKTVFGGVFADPDGPGGMPGVNIGMALHQLDLRAAVGKDLHKANGMAIFARVGYRYQGFLIDNVTDATKNPVKLPSEVFQAPTIGAMLAIPHLTDKLGLRVALDAAVFGTSITQTKGYEDGASPSAKAACFGAVVTYKWKKDMDLQGSYDFNYESIDFGAPTAMNLRGHTGTDVSRADFFHIISFGVVKGF